MLRRSDTALSVNSASIRYNKRQFTSHIASPYISVRNNEFQKYRIPFDRFAFRLLKSPRNYVL